LSAAQQLQIMEALEDAASDSQWYDLGNTLREFISDAPFICQLKELTVWGFFTSQEGASQVLRYNPMPMYFDGDIPLASDENSWSSPL
jgi:gluconate 2-dehydrogenase gamma chain